MQNFEMADAILKYDHTKSILLCLSRSSETKNKWIKKLLDITSIMNVIEDEIRYYVACESGEKNGQLLALNKDNGITDWFIPGRSFLSILFEGYIYFIFIDDKDRYYLIKVNKNTGKTAWHHEVDQDLNEYSFTNKRICLLYTSGKKELLSVKTGKKIADN